MPNNKYINIINSLMIDLHTHSTASDGQYTPDELVQMAKDKGLSAFAISDHDTIDGTLSSIKKGEEIGVRVISAVEISVSFREHALHILWYNFNPHDNGLKSALEDINSYRKNRAVTIIGNINNELMNDGKVPIDINEILKLGIEKPIIRTDLARYLLNHGYVNSEREAFDKWLIKYNILNKSFSVEQAINLIHDVWGVAVLAHPGAEEVSLLGITKSLNEQRDIIIDFQEKWLDGIEVYRSNQTMVTENTYLEIANSLWLIPTGWSDFHSPRYDWSPDIWNNRAPDNITDRILELWAKIKMNGYNDLKYLTN